MQLLNEFLEGEFDRILMLLELALQANVINMTIDKEALRESLSDLHRSVICAAALGSQLPRHR